MDQNKVSFAKGEGEEETRREKTVTFLSVSVYIWRRIKMTWKLMENKKLHTADSLLLFLAMNKREIPRHVSNNVFAIQD